MPPSDQPEWQPISRLPLVASLIDGGFEEAAAQRQILTEARTRPHLLDDATLDRVDAVYGEEQQWLGFCEEQLRRWQQDRPSPAEEREIGRLVAEIERLKPLVARSWPFNRRNLANVGLNGSLVNQGGREWIRFGRSE
jgi:hypothetical protein